jgi:hypothetical protein
METNTLDQIKAALSKLKTSKVELDEDTDDVKLDNWGMLGALGSTSSSYTISTSSIPNYGNVTINSSGNMGIGNSYQYYSNGTIPPLTTGPLTAGSGLYVKSDAEFEGDIKWKGRSLGKLLEGIEDRLALLPDPDPKKLEKFAALKKAYDHYKLMEKLIGDDTDVNS